MSRTKNTTRWVPDPSSTDPASNPDFWTDRTMTFLLLLSPGRCCWTPEWDSLSRIHCPCRVTRSQTTLRPVERRSHPHWGHFYPGVLQPHNNLNKEDLALEDCHEDPSRWRCRWYFQVTQVVRKKILLEEYPLCAGLCCGWGLRSLSLGLLPFGRRQKMTIRIWTWKKRQFLFFRTK